MSNENPYAPPEANVEVAEAGQTVLAGRGARLGGAVIDTIISFAIILPVMKFSGAWERALTQEQTIFELLGLSVLSFILFLAVHGYLLANYGQTVGKRLVKTRIVSVQDERILPFPRLVGLRYLPVAFVSQIPLLGPILSLVDVLYIFREDRRCVHDLIAGTKVIKA